MRFFVMHVHVRFFAGLRESVGLSEVELSLAELEPVTTTRPSYSFRVDDLPIGLYQLKLRPLQKKCRQREVKHET